jgi:hypothetical protein
MDQTLIDWIDAASYEQLLRRWRFAPSGDPLFQGEVGEYYKKALAEAKEAVGPAEAVAASKRIGWE